MGPLFSDPCILIADDWLLISDYFLRSFERTQSYNHFLLNQLLVNTYYLRYTSSVSNKRPLAPAFPVCRFSFADGRRCALPATPESNGLCYTHANAAHRRLRPSDLSRELIVPPGTLVPPEKIVRLLSKVPIAMAQGLITPKEAGNLAYLCNVLLQTARAARGATPAVDPHAEWAVMSRFLNDDDDEITEPPLDPFDD